MLYAVPTHRRGGGPHHRFLGVFLVEKKITTIVALVTVQGVLNLELSQEQNLAGKLQELYAPRTVALLLLANNKIITAANYY